jgi:hypothetical protein
MKKLSAPSNPPEAYTNMVRSPSVLKTETDVTDKLSVSSIDLNEPETRVPASRVYNYNLKKMKSFKQIRRSRKMTNQKALFIYDLGIVLNDYSSVDHDLDSDLLVHILNISEQYFIYGTKEERELMKMEAVKTLMAKYFRDDDVLLNKFITQVWPKVIKSNMLKRCWSRFTLFFKI